MGKSLTSLDVVEGKWVGIQFPIPALPFYHWETGGLPSLSIGVLSHHWLNEGDGRTCFLDEMILYTEGRAWVLLAPMKSQPQWAVLASLPEWASLKME